MEALMQRAKLIEDRYAGLLCYFVMIPFLHPRGFDECWPWYKTLFTLWLYLALVVIAAWVVYDLVSRGLRYKKCVIWIVGYHLLFIVVTLLTQRGIHEGLQKMFAVPSICVFCGMQMRQRAGKFLRTVANLLIAVFVLDLTVFCVPVVSEMIQKYHVTFLGHVQVAAQEGLVGLLAGYLLWRYDPEQKERAIIVMALSVLSVMLADTVASLLILLFLAACLIMWFIRPTKKLLMLDSRLYVWGAVLLSMALMAYALLKLDIRTGSNALSLNGRTFVWRDGLKLFLSKPFLGYGAYGATIVTFWSEGMNYAHNEFLQRLLDGGVVLTACFGWMLLSCAGNVNRIGNKQDRALANVMLVALLLLMQIESVTEYYFSFMLLVLLAYMPGMLKRAEKK